MPAAALAAAAPGACQGVGGRPDRAVTAEVEVEDDSGTGVGVA